MAYRQTYFGIDYMCKTRDEGKSRKINRPFDKCDNSLINVNGEY